MLTLLSGCHGQWQNTQLLDPNCGAITQGRRPQQERLRPINSRRPYEGTRHPDLSGYERLVEIP